MRDLLIEKIVLNQKDLLALETVLRAAIAFLFAFYLMNQMSMSTLPLMPSTLPLDEYCHMAKS